jgi:methylenetetrahydrofolate reductase (NADPH)
LDDQSTMTDNPTFDMRLDRGDFVFTAEITPPVSASPDDLLARALPLKGLVDAVNVTDGASARVHMSSIAAAATLAAYDIEPIAQFTCRDRNRIALMSDLLGAAALGIHNLLILRGDDPTRGDQPTAKAVFDMESAELMAVVRDMSARGTFPSSATNADGEDEVIAKTLPSKPDFFIGAADMPNGERNEAWLKGLHNKVASGAKFVQTQLCYDMELVARYASILQAEGIVDQLHVLIGNGPLPSVKSALWMRDNLYGVAMPDEIIDRLDRAEDAKAEGVRICIEQAEAMSAIPGISGVHLMAPVNTVSIPAVIRHFRS